MLLLVMLSLLLVGGLKVVGEEARIIREFTYFTEEGGKVVLRVDGKTAFVKDVIKIEGIQVTWYPEEDEEKRVVLVAERGSLDTETGDLQVEGSATAVSPEWGEINADRLEWKAKEKKIIARGNVRARFKLPREKASAED